jgi:hypothetical protein
VHFGIDGFRKLLRINSDEILNAINHLIFVMVRFGVLFAVGTESLNTTWVNITSNG